MSDELPLLPEDIDREAILEVSRMGVYRGSDDATTYLVWGECSRRIALRFRHKGMLGTYARILLDQVEPRPEREVLDALHRIEKLLQSSPRQVKWSKTTRPGERWRSRDGRASWLAGSQKYPVG